MQKSKYQLIDYWWDKIQQGEVLLSGLFEGVPINRNSIIIAPTMLHSYRNIGEIIVFLKWQHIKNKHIRPWMVIAKYRILVVPL